MALQKLSGWRGLRGRELRFVILQHQETPSKHHYDLLFELRPGDDPNKKTLFGLKRTRLPDRGARTIRWCTHGHRRRRYLTFQGDIGKGRGTVTRVDAGTYSIQRVQGQLTISMRGTLLHGVYRLRRAERGIHVWVLSSGESNEP